MFSIRWLDLIFWLYNKSLKHCKKGILLIKLNRHYEVLTLLIQALPEPVIKTLAKKTKALR